MMRGQRFELVGRYNCLDFVNTEFTNTDGGQVELLRDFADLIEWLKESHLINRKKTQHALKSCAGGDAARVYQGALALRGALRAMAETLVARQPVPRRSIDAINETIAKCPGRVLLARRAGHFEEKTRLDLRKPEQLMVPIAQSASDLLCHGEPALVKRCANPACRVFFYDTSKNHNGRWCSRRCGNRMRVAAHYRRRSTQAALESVSRGQRQSGRT